jgi:hypothetical protein
MIGIENDIGSIVGTHIERYIAIDILFQIRRIRRIEKVSIWARSREYKADRKECRERDGDLGSRGFYNLK